MIDGHSLKTGFFRPDDSLLILWAAGRRRSARVGSILPVLQELTLSADVAIGQIEDVPLVQTGCSVP